MKNEKRQRAGTVVGRPFLIKLLDAASMQRWNDKIRPVELRELDKQAHKMIIAYFFGKFSETEHDFDWIEIIEAGLFEFLERLVLTDLKPQIFERIKEDREKYLKLNEWVLKKLDPVIAPFGRGLVERFQNHFSRSGESLNFRIVRAAHVYATRWEFDIVERANPGGHEILQIRESLQRKQEQFYDLPGVQQLALYQRYRSFVDLCGQLRFQLRWGHINMVPRISVLGHMLIVAILSYLFSVELGACSRRMANNYFTGLFHDLPEVLTRDIISPVKRSVEGLEEIIKSYEREQMEKEVYRLIPDEWRREMRLFTENEFQTVVTVDGNPQVVDAQALSRDYNEDRFNPRDGEMIKAIDDLAAFVEAENALANGIRSRDLRESESSIRTKYADRKIGSIDFGAIFAQF